MVVIRIKRCRNQLVYTLVVNTLTFSNENSFFFLSFEGKPVVIQTGYQGIRCCCQRFLAKGLSFMTI